MSDDSTARVAELVALAKRGLAQMCRPEKMQVVQTMRRVDGSPLGLRAEGENLRYAAIVALGSAHLPSQEQAATLGGPTAAEFSEAASIAGAQSTDPGAAALAAWASAEVRGAISDDLSARLIREVEQSRPVPTVDFAWTLSALVAARRLGDFAGAAEQAAERLLAAQGEMGVFPHALPMETLGRHRAHVGCFADQVYPIQALTRYFGATGDQRALDAANRCARRIVQLQGPAGQWWWHYDVRAGGAVVEGYPVYSVHQHAMGPMALRELRDAGGDDHSAPIEAGVAWLYTHPETSASLIDERAAAVWRKVGRREPRKLVRSLRAMSTAVRPGMRVRALDHLFPAGPVDYECRPYEFGWLLYAWLPAQPEAAAE